MLNFLRRNLSFTKLASINLFSKLGDRLFYTAMLTIATTLPQSQLAITIVSVSETLPIIASFLLGTLADQKAKKLRALSQNSLLRALLYCVIAILAGYHHTLRLLLIMAGLNFLSDLLGNYSSSLIIPFTKSLIKDADLTQAQGLLSLTNQLINVLATLAGSLLLAIWQPNYLAFLNASIFLLVSFSYHAIQTQLQHVEQQMPLHHPENMAQATGNNFHLLLQKKDITRNLLQLAFINGFFGGLTPIFVMFLKNNRNLPLLSQPIKIALLSVITTIFMVIGNSYSIKIFTQQSIQFLATIADLFMMLAAWGLLRNNLYLVLINVAGSAFLLGIISPRFSAQIIRTFPGNNLGGIVTIANALLTLTPPLTSMIFPLISGYSLTLSYWSFGIYGLLALLLQVKKVS
ncbi:MFS transporter [Bombilactobacillus thymidiniphilus]|uniref:MFS transporter n=1 Tax=Bombilactobacillus thymidiniphilus TaxID=2923363 RepID=A0ABY4PCR4_9LACO|nr:MFS transporter [Bombilactobacillus thymidiniphilus]UQS83067.1 MFS transporter [Bombilactobacillus thymidiniphilus]